MEEVMKKDAFEGHLRDYIAQYEGKNVVLSVDRLDYAKAHVLEHGTTKASLQIAWSLCLRLLAWASSWTRIQ
eukprot:3071810-Amphidinium_carterae.1